MNESDIRQLMTLVAEGSVDIEEAIEQLKSGPFRTDATGFATPDFHRRLRLGMSEVVYGEHKTAEQILEIVARLSQNDTPVLITRLNEDQQWALRDAFPGGRANEAARTYMVYPPEPRAPAEGEPFVAIVSAGTSDFRVVEEAAEVCVASGVAFERICDVGVAGPHRLVSRLPILQRAAAIVVAAGMDGALPSVIGGMVGRPVIGVPTSIGYGASFGGLAALLTMLNSCAPGVTVTNIDNGFSAAVAACNIVRSAKDASCRAAR
jgi:NCAIR mutase (PurE)-related protein